MKICFIYKKKQMGVKDLWSILSSVGDKKPLWELRNETVAIDLSVWICENQQINRPNNNMYLRNLFFRTVYMLLLGIKPIFVLEGKAPDLKHKTIQNRKLTHGKSNIKSNYFEQGKRSRLNSLQKQCQELLHYMGLTCVCSEGEAEALCAALNNHNIVSGVISKDSDCFLYGAHTVYRNFNISSDRGTVEKYTISKIEEKLFLGRNKLIALSLLCGCDYNEKGIEGVGKETALKYLSTVDESDVLEKLSKWRENTSEIESSMSKLEKNLKQKALLNPAFPFYDIQKEFLCQDYDISEINFCWQKPNIKKFVEFVERKLAWNTNYALEKFLPLLSRWHIIHDETEKVLDLEYIVKKRNLRSILSYEVKWKDFDQITIEPASLLKLKYAKAVDTFENAKLSKLKKNKNKKSADLKKNIINETSELNNLRFNTIKSTISHSPLEPDEESITVSDFECSASDLLELSFVVESIITR